MLAWKGTNARTEDFGMGFAPPRCEPAELAAPSFSVKRALETYKESDAPGPAQALSSQARKRLMRELKHLSEHPHPAMDVLPSETNIAFWKVVMAEPSGMCDSECVRWDINFGGNYF